VGFSPRTVTVLFCLFVPGFGDCKVGFGPTRETVSTKGYRENSKIEKVEYT